MKFRIPAIPSSCTRVVRGVQPLKDPFSLGMIRHGGQEGKAGTEKARGRLALTTRVPRERACARAREPRREFHREIHRFNGSTVAVRVWTAL